MKELPPGWADATFGDVADYISRGKSPKYTVKSSLPVINQKAIRWFGIQDEHLKFVHEEQFEHWSFERFISNGDILWNSTGTGTIGRACLVKPEHLSPQKVVDSHVTIVRPNKKVIDPRYLFAWIRGPEVQGMIEDLATGTTNQIELNRSTIAATHVPVAPVNEQKRIADKLDAVLARVDACSEHLERIPGILKRFRQSVLAAATSGKLTEDWRSTNGRCETWPLVRLADIGELGRGKSKHRPRNDPRLYGGQYPFIQTGNIAQSGGQIIRHDQTYNEFGLSQSKLWPADTVCITIAANIADTAILTYPACFPDSVVGFIADKSKSLPYFVKWFIETIKDRLDSFAPATAQKNINLAVLNDLQVRCPPIDEQAEIVKRVQALFVYADRLEFRYQKACTQIERLTPAILAKAFRGELVPQDPNDEPASVLLEPIRATRAAEPVQSRTKRGAGRAKKIQKSEGIMLQRHEIKATHLTSILKERGPLTAEALWSASQLDIDDFYDQLKVEEEQGYLQEQRSDALESPRLLEAAA